MEAVAAAASITGVASLTVQCVDSIIKLRSFYQDIRFTSKEIEGFIRDVGFLEKVLSGAQEICSSIEAIEPSQRPSFNLASLQIQIEDCSRDLIQWLEEAQRLHPSKWPEGPAKGTLFTFKRLRAVLEKRGVKNMKSQLESYERGINSCLAVLGRQLDLRQSSTLQSIDAHVHATENTSEIILTQVYSHTQIVQDVASSAGSIRALSQSSADRLEVIDATTRRTAEAMARMMSHFEKSRSSPGLHSSSSGPETTNSQISTMALAPVNASLEEVQIPEYNRDRRNRAAEYARSLRTRRREYIKSLERELESTKNHSTLIESLRQKIRDLEEQLGDARAGRPMRKNVFHGDFSSFLDETASLLPPPVADFLAEGCRWSILDAHRRIINEMVHPGVDQGILQTNKSRAMYYISKKIERAQADFAVARKTCLREGHDISGYSSLVPVSQNNLEEVLENNPDSRALEYYEPDFKPLTDNFGVASQSEWRSTRERVNSWLLDCLRSSETLSQTHRSMLNIPDLGEREWARLVLKYWTLDGAATGGRDSATSSDGAVGSLGGRETERAALPDHLKRGPASSISGLSGWMRETKKRTRWIVNSAGALELIRVNPYTS